MPWTIYRYILWDLLKLVWLTTSVLVTVISVAAAIKPLSEGLLSAESLFKFVGYTSPTMLAFALPFAGAFAATIVFLRLSADNEITAMSASGISYLSILTPLLVLGSVLFLSLLLLSNFVIPSFYRAAAQTVERDVMSLLVTSLNGERPFEMGEYVLYADRAQERPPTAAEFSELTRSSGGVEPAQLVILEGVAVGRVQEDAKVAGDMTAQRATVALFRDGISSWVTVRLRNMVYFSREEGRFLQQDTQDLGPLALPTPLQDDPQFLSFSQLRRLREAPERYGNIGRYKLELADSIAAAKLRTEVTSRLMRSRESEDEALRLVSSGGAAYSFAAPSVRVEGPDVLLESRPRRPVVVRSSFEGREERRYEAESAKLLVERTRGAEEPSVVAELYNARVYLGDGVESRTQQARLPLPRLGHAGELLDIDPDALNAFQLYAAAKQQYSQFPIVDEAAERLISEIARLAYKITGQLHQRAATAVSCFLLLLLGAILSMWLRGHIPLVVYFWSFALAIISIIITHTGTNLAGGASYPLWAALTFLWSGNLILAGVIGVVYCRMART